MIPHMSFNREKMLELTWKLPPCSQALVILGSAIQGRGWGGGGASKCHHQVTQYYLCFTLPVCQVSCIKRNRHGYIGGSKQLADLTWGLIYRMEFMLSVINLVKSPWLGASFRNPVCWRNGRHETVSSVRAEVEVKRHTPPTHTRCLQLKKRYHIANIWKEHTVKFIS